ncbi:MAG: hypothetical protein IMX01_10390 [Limnochordaceae bacterium]|nr:hypothetical protein [Limnochordaceae bacterium]
MPEMIILLAVTDMDNAHFCIAGVSDGQWARPVLRPTSELPRQLTADDINTDGELWKPWDIIEVEKFFAVPRALPHSEDLGFEPRSARRVGYVDEPAQRAELLARYACADDSWLKLLNGEGRRSLCLVRAAQLSWFPNPYDPKKKRATLAIGRTTFNREGKGYSVVDHYASDWCNGAATMSSVSTPYVLLGLSRLYKERFWPMVLRAFCAPDYR